MTDPWRHLIGQIAAGRGDQITWPMVARARGGGVVLMLDPAHRSRWTPALTLVPAPRRSASARWRKIVVAAVTLLVAMVLSAFFALASQRLMRSAASGASDGIHVAAAAESHVDWSRIRDPESVLVELIRLSVALGAMAPAAVPESLPVPASVAARVAKSLRLAGNAAASAPQLGAGGDAEVIDLRSFAMLASLDPEQAVIARRTLSDFEVSVPLVARKVVKAKQTSVVPAKKSAIAKKKGKKATVAPKRARSRVAAVDMLELRKRWLAENDSFGKQR